jgi:hypothetical protein
MMLGLIAFLAVDVLVVVIFAMCRAGGQMGGGAADPGAHQKSRLVDPPDDREHGEADAHGGGEDHEDPGGGGRPG